MILTGSPEGAGPLKPGDMLEAHLNEKDKELADLHLKIEEKFVF